MIIWGIFERGDTIVICFAVLDPAGALLMVSEPGTPGKAIGTLLPPLLLVA